MSWREVLKAEINFSQYPDYDGTPRRKLSSFEQEMVEQNKKGDYKVRECENCDVVQHRGRPLMYEVQFVNLPSRSGRPEFGGHYCDVCLEGIPNIDSDGNAIYSRSILRRDRKMDEESNRLIQDMREN